MFRDDKQRVRACRAILSTVGLQNLWGDTGPTLDGDKMKEGLSGGERVMVSVAWDLWNGDEHGARLTDVLYRLDGEKLMAVAGFLSAFADGTIDHWCRFIENHNGRVPLSSIVTADDDYERCGLCGNASHPLDCETMYGVKPDGVKP